MKILFWTIPMAVAFCGLCYSVAIYNIEDAKQTASMMKVCTDAGGMWGANWGPARCTWSKPR